MKLCSRCNKNMAVIFVTKVENGKETPEGLCFECAKKSGIKPLDNLLNQLGINAEDFGVKFDLGDTIMVAHFGYGVTGHLKVIEFNRVSEHNRLSSKLIFGDPKLSILKGITV